MFKGVLLVLLFVLVLIFGPLALILGSQYIVSRFADPIHI